ncbi:helix-turn-helix domain-containing protein [Candidatus Parcubacteria bacterium]|nr:helix-turn-helix domain-containing protein [Candidatus Parcubacteria bacterium]
MQNELKQLGLTDNEIKVYITLLEIGENTVGPIINKLKIHRQVAYDALEGLEKKNFVDRIIKTKRYHYRVSDPKNVLDEIKRKENIANNLIPEINKKIKGQERGQEIKIYEGEKAFRELTLKNDGKMSPNSKTYVITGSTKKYLEIMEISKAFEKSKKIRKKKKITTKIIFLESQRDESKKINRDYSELKFLAEGYASPVAFQIWTESISLISYGSEIFVIEIKNKDFRDAYLNYFNLLWKIAKK